MRPIVEAIGLDWATQYRKLHASGQRFGVLAYANTSAGGMQEMTCIPLRRYPMWLATINSAKIPNPVV
jgi:hypothetical protein